MIKDFIIGKSLHLVKDIYPEYDSIKTDEIRYGLEAIYLSLTKVVVILLATLFLGIFKEAVIVLIFFNILRTTGFGIHAKKSWMCWISSSIFFIGIPYLCIYASFPVYMHAIVLGISMISFILYAPADTKKRPLVRKNKRMRFKILTLIIAIIYIGLFIYTDSSFLRNVISSTMLLEAVLIHPLTYRLFHLPYKNYEGYVFSK